jgi:hypothetical protein
MVLLKSLKFWTLLVGLVLFAVKWYFPTFPLTFEQLLAAVLFFLGLVDIVPTLRAQGLRALATSPIVNSLAFWQLVAGLVAFILTTFAPNIGISPEIVLGVILFVLGLFQVHPELRARGLI